MKEFGDMGYEATRVELDDILIGMDAVEMLKMSEVSIDIYKNALSYLVFLKCKQTGNIKARGCANGQPWRKFISKEESS